MQHERHLNAADDHCFESLDALLDGPFALCMIVTDADGIAVDYRFLRVSTCFTEATGLSDLEGRSATEALPGIGPDWIERYGAVALGGPPIRIVETHPESGREYEVRSASLPMPGRFVIHFRDLTELRRLEAERAQALARAEHLLRELGHRVMNGFAAISAILAMEGRASAPEGRAALARVQGRVQALASLYRLLDGAPDADRLEVSGYLRGIVGSFRDSLAAPEGVAVEAELSPLWLSTRAAVPLGLVLNELLTNAVKHAFDGAPGTIRVSLSEGEGARRLCVADDGRGMAEGEGSAGIGRSLIAAFVGELGGELSTETGPAGTAVTVVFRA